MTCYLRITKFINRNSFDDASIWWREFVDKKWWNANLKIVTAIHLPIWTNENVQELEMESSNGSGDLQQHRSLVAVIASSNGGKLCRQRQSPWIAQQTSMAISSGGDEFSYNNELSFSCRDELSDVGELFLYIFLINFKWNKINKF